MKSFLVILCIFSVAFAAPKVSTYLLNLYIFRKLFFIEIGITSPHHLRPSQKNVNYAGKVLPKFLVIWVVHGPTTQFHCLMGTCVITLNPHHSASKRLTSGGQSLPKSSMTTLLHNMSAMMFLMASVRSQWAHCHGVRGRVCVCGAVAVAGGGTWQWRTRTLNDCWTARTADEGAEGPTS